LARKPNYDFEKRKKEQDRKAKKDAKREDRLARKRAGQDPDLADMESPGGETSDAETSDEAPGAGDDTTAG
jgi:hypothetical protein